MFVVMLNVELWEILGAGAADVGSIGQRVSGKSEIWPGLPRVWGTESLLLAGQCIPAETCTATDALSTHYQQSV